MTTDAPPTYSVAELNAAIGSLLERGFAPRFLVQATASRPQIKKGHLWLTLTDGNASITAVVWASRLQQLNFVPGDGDGVLVVGKLNFWAARASLAVQVLDLRPSLTTVMRRFEEVREQLLQEGLIDPSRQRPLPRYPRRVALLTSSPSSALADMLRTARERWPLTSLLLLPIPVQGDVAQQIVQRLQRLTEAQPRLAFDAIVLARGGGSREDLMVFDDADVCRQLAMSPVPLITGIGHEDDLTVADLVADHRAATPTAAIVALLPDRRSELQTLENRRRHLKDGATSRLRQERERLMQRRAALQLQSPLQRIGRLRETLHQKQKLLEALSPDRWLQRGLALITGASGEALTSVASVKIGDQLTIRMRDGQVTTRVEQKQAPQRSKRS